MTPLEMAARFTAFTWYVNNRKASTRTKEAEAKRFAERSWREFLPMAHQGLGRFLLRIARPRKARGLSAMAGV
jgi:hypothetical protein